MEITTRYDLGNRVFSGYGDEELIVVGINPMITESNREVYYECEDEGGCRGMYEESEVFPTREELFKSLGLTYKDF